MQAASVKDNHDNILISVPQSMPAKIISQATVSSPMISGIYKRIIQVCCWINVAVVTLMLVKNPFVTFKKLKQLVRKVDEHRGNHKMIKYAKAGSKYYFSFNAPGWPSKAFNQYIKNCVLKLDAKSNRSRLDLLLFGITKKCGYQCEHCFEWDALNKPETLSKENILSVIHSFQRMGVTQVQLSGGEPLNRFDDIIFLLQNIDATTEVWLYTSGYHFTAERAVALKQNGLSGIIVSLDHWQPELHNMFRGKKNAFEWAEKAIANARHQGLVTCLSLCATKSFISQYNLQQYAALAKSWGVPFVQVLEPKAVGHYAGKDVAISDEQRSSLDAFYIDYNYNPVYKDYPSVIYHGFYSRRIGCAGAGNIYAFVDTDGDVHPCPFCRCKSFSALDDDTIEENISRMKSGGCGAYTGCSIKKSSGSTC